MRQEAPGETEIGVGRESFGDLLSRLATASAGLVRDEIELVKQEMREKVKSLRTAMILAGAAGVLAIIALFTLDAALVIGVGKAIGFGWSALAIGVAVAIIAGIFACLGMSQFKRTSLKPEETIQSLKEDREWLKKIT